jgi:hypothetical protein
MPLISLEITNSGETVYPLSKDYPHARKLTIVRTWDSGAGIDKILVSFPDTDTGNVETIMHGAPPTNRVLLTPASNGSAPLSFPCSGIAQKFKVTVHGTTAFPTTSVPLYLFLHVT